MFNTVENSVLISIMDRKVAGVKEGMTARSSICCDPGEGMEARPGALIEGGHNEFKVCFREKFRELGDSQEVEDNGREGAQSSRC